jgi:hypothetical protein
MKEIRVVNCNSEYGQGAKPSVMANCAVR